MHLSLTPNKRAHLKWDNTQLSDDEVREGREALTP